MGAAQSPGLREHLDVTYPSQQYRLYAVGLTADAANSQSATLTGG